MHAPRPALCLLALLAACGGTGAAPAASTSADSAAIAAALDAYIAAGVANDDPAMLSFWPEDGVYINTGMSTVRGRSGIDSLIRAFHSAFRVTDLQVDTEELAVSGDLAYMWGTYRETVVDSASQSQLLNGRFLFVWRREPDGSWKIARAIGTDMGN